MTNNVNQAAPPPQTPQPPRGQVVTSVASQRLKDEAEFSKVPKAFFPSVSPNLLEQKVVFFVFLFLFSMSI